MMKVENLENANGRIVPNQFVIYGNDGTSIFKAIRHLLRKSKIIS